MRRPEDRVSRFLQLHDGESRKEAGTIRASPSPQLSMLVRTQAHPYGSESVIQHDSFRVIRIHTVTLAVMRRKWLGLVQPDDAANRQLPMLTPSSHVLYLVFSILVPRS
jgi:hypothetical protein